MKLGEWLRQQRQARSWSQREMARRIIQAGRTCGDTAMPHLDSMYRNVHRWETGQTALTERYELYWCKALGFPAGQFGTAPLPPAGGTGDAPPPVPRASSVTALDQPLGPGLARFTVEREVLGAAHEGSDHAERYEQHRVGEATFEQLRADVTRLARLSDTGEPFPVFLDTRRVRDRIHRLLDRRLWSREQTGLHFLLGCLNGLMGVTAGRLGHPDAAEELIRAGWASAAAIDHRPLLAQLRLQLADVAYLRGSFQDSRDLAVSGLSYLSAGSIGANLHLKHARAAARLGETDLARRAIGEAHEARDPGSRDELVAMGGAFAISQATHCAFAGAALAEVAGAGREATEELERAIGSYDEGPAGHEDHWFAGQPLAGIDLAMVRLRSGALDGAAAALEPAFALPAAQRITQVTTRLIAVRAELAASIFRGSPQARELSEQIEEFGRQSILAGLSPGSPGA